MRVTIDLEKTKQLNELYHSIEEKDRKEPHLSDGLYCPLKSYCRITGLPAIWSRRTKAIFNIGEDLHGEFELPFEHHEVDLKYGPSFGHPDVIEDWEDVGPEKSCRLLHPLEFKHTRLTVRSVDDIPVKWIHQLLLECIYIWKDENVGGFRPTFGWLAIMEVVSGVGTVWKIKFDEKKMEEEASFHLAKMETIELAVKTKNPGILTPDREECSSCQYNHKDGCPRRPGASYNV